MRRWLLLFLLHLSLPSVAQKIRVAVAANAQFVVGKLQTAFEKQTGLPIEPVVGSSGKLTAQIQQGAPFDVFLSADMDYPTALYQSGHTATKPRIYAYGLLVLWTRADLDPAKGPSMLADTRVHKIAVANPRTAPYGAVAMDILTRQKLLPSLQSRLVYGESIAQVNQYLLSGAVEAGFTAKSVVLEPSLKGKGRWAEVKGAAPIAQGAVLLKGATANAQTFYNFLFSAQAGAIFRQYGYRIPTRQ